MATPEEYLIDDILPAYEIHLIGGSSGSGKTTFTLQTIADWLDGKPIFGHASHPIPYAYISIDRSHSSVTRTLQRIGLENKITRIICREDFTEPIRGLGSVIQFAQKTFPDAKVLFIEGFQTLVGDKGNSYTPVANLLTAATVFCAEQGMTIIGICHSPKMKIEEGFQHPREVILGSVAWAAFSDTVITMDLNEKTGVVTVRIMPRNAPLEAYELFFGKQGVLTPVNRDGRKDALTKMLTMLPSGTVVTRKEILDLADSVHVSERSAERTITELIATEDLESLSRGTYRRISPSIH